MIQNINLLYLVLIVFGVAIIQLPSRKGAQHAFNVPNRYLITKPKSMNTIKNIFRIKYLKNYKIVLEYFLSLSMKYCSMRKRKTLVTYGVCITKRPTEIYYRFLNKEKWFSQVIWMFSTFRECCLLPEKEMRSHCIFTDAKSC